jgi:hypothetical protein
VRSSKRIDALEKQVTYLAEQADELQAHLRPESLRTRRALFVGGQSDGQYQWIDEATPTIRRPHARVSDWALLTPMDEMYRLVGRSPIFITEYLYEFASIVQRPKFNRA